MRNRKRRIQKEGKKKQRSSAEVPVWDLPAWWLVGFSSEFLTMIKFKNSKKTERTYLSYFMCLCPVCKAGRNSSGQTFTSPYGPGIPIWVIMIYSDFSPSSVI